MKENCEGRMRTIKKFKSFKKIPHICVLNAAEIEMQKCRNRVQKDVTAPVRTIFQKEIAGIDFVFETPSYENVKSTL